MSRPYIRPLSHLLLTRAAEEATSAQFSDIQPEHAIMALLTFSELTAADLGEVDDADLHKALTGEIAHLRRFVDSNSMASTTLRRALRAAIGRGPGAPGPGQRVIHRTPRLKETFRRAEDAFRAGRQPGFYECLLQALLADPTDALRTVLAAHNAPAPRPAAMPPQSSPLSELAQRISALNRSLKETVFGQDHAINAFAEGLFNAELAGGADGRGGVSGLFVFAGPPGVGKTFLAESGAKALGRSFKRFDMSGYSDHQAGADLIGMNSAYKNAQPGQLTGFVESHPDAVLLFDEIEKAHINTIHLFLQILDAGRLEDKFHDKSVDFRGTIVIFTTNAGKSLYEHDGDTGVHQANASFHRKTILNALESEKDSRTGQPFFPGAICSRMATGFPILFNRLDLPELTRVVLSEMSKQGEIIRKKYGFRFSATEAVAQCLVLGAGGGADARTVRAQAEGFVRGEIFKLTQLYDAERISASLGRVDTVSADLDPASRLPEELAALDAKGGTVSVLLVADKVTIELWTRQMPEIDWRVGWDWLSTTDALALGEPDFAIIDLWLGLKAVRRPAQHNGTHLAFDRVPLNASGLAEGREVLYQLKDHYPSLPRYLLSIDHCVDEGLLSAASQSGGAKGILDLPGPERCDWSQIVQRLRQMGQGGQRERLIAALMRERKVLTFDTVPKQSADGRQVSINLRNLRLARSVSANDVGEILSDVERPTIKLDDIYGADAAKAELQMLVDWLRNPARFKAMGMKAPRGVLLYGPPGTGKTMLARALAGETNVAYLSASASSFVTKWQGSGPENVRELFKRARRYAPAIVFIDEIDAIGRKRTGGDGGGSVATEQTLNALLTEMDGFTARDNRPVIVIAATNLVENLDDALRRRFDRDIEVDKPDTRARLRYLERRLLDNDNCEIDGDALDNFATLTAGLTIADLERIVEMATRLAITQQSTVTVNLLQECFERIFLGDIKDGTCSPEVLLRVARHEAGHCIVGWTEGRHPLQLSIVARGRIGGYSQTSADEQGIALYSKRDMEGLIRECMAGRAAEMLCYGDEDGLSSGVASDLKAATEHARRMVCSFGMSDEIGMVALGQGGDMNTLEIRTAVESIVRAQLVKAKEILEEKRPLFDCLVDELIRKNRLNREDLSAILSSVDQ